jgi:Domain of unknown function (DUF4411)
VSYVFDNGPFSALFRNFYPKTFPSLWERFHALVADGAIVSTREVLREIEDSSLESMQVWAKDHAHLFRTPTASEGAFIVKIYGVLHFQNNIEQQKLLKGGKMADPFVIARAVVENRTVVTMDKQKPNAAKIPNICAHFGVRCLHLETFMEREGWQF